MGRSPFCDKIGLKKGPWTPEEDKKLLVYIQEHGHGSWRVLPAKAGLQRCGKSCRLRWTNYLRPDIKRGKFSLQEEQTIIQLHALLGNRWSAIATHLPKRTDNEIKNYWNTHLKKRLAKMGIDPVTHKPENQTLLCDGGESKDAASLSHVAQWESARLEAEARLVRQSRLGPGSVEQAQNPEFAPDSSLLNKPVGPSTSLHVPNAWRGGAAAAWAKTSLAGGASSGASMAGTGGELESPKSTVSEEVLKQLPAQRDGTGNPVQFPSECASEFGRGSSSDHVSCGNFVEKFTDLLLSLSPADQRSSEDGGGSDSSGGGGGGCGGGDYDEDNENYWNTILELVNSSPSDSPIF